jgi:hypothetical protein
MPTLRQRPPSRVGNPDPRDSSPDEFGFSLRRREPSEDHADHEIGFEAERHYQIRGATVLGRCQQPKQAASLLVGYLIIWVNHS